MVARFVGSQFTIGLEGENDRDPKCVLRKGERKRASRDFLFADKNNSDPVALSSRQFAGDPVTAQSLP